MWTPPFTFEEKLKYALIPPRLYMWRLIRKHLKRGEAELKLLPELVPAGKIAIDIGANKGVHTHLLSKIAPVVHAFEPNPKAFYVLKRALPRNVMAHFVALSDRNGHAELLIPMRKGGFSNQHGSLNPRKKTQDHGVVRVECRRLDSYGFTNVGFIKIDVEGFEKAVLEGAADTIRREQPTLMIELEERHTGEPIEDLITFVEGFGLTAHFVKDGALRPIAEFDPDRDHRNRADQPGYIFNFIFIPKA